MTKSPLPFDPIAEAERQWRAHELPEPLAMTAATSVMRAHQLISSGVDSALRPFDLTFARYEVLMLLSFSRTGSLPLSKMGERLMVHPTSITNLVDKLEAAGFVRRDAHPTDRRATLATITRSGRAVARRSSAAVGEIRFGVPLGAHELKDLVRVLAALRLEAHDFDPS